MSVEEIVSELERTEIPDNISMTDLRALIADWRLRGELLKAERLHIIELEVENAELVALRAEYARLRSKIAVGVGQGRP
jgi:hypothetical protein